MEKQATEFDVGKDISDSGIMDRDSEEYKDGKSSWNKEHSNLAVT